MTINNLEGKDGINLDDSVVKLFRKIMLESAAEEQKSDLYCPECHTNLPYTPMTVGQEPDGFDANYNLTKKIVYRCTLCEIDFHQ